MAHPLIAELAALRRYHGLTQAEVAERVGVNKATIQNIEKGRHKTSFATVAAYAEAIGHKIELTKETA